MLKFLKYEIKRTKKYSIFFLLISLIFSISIWSIAYIQKDKFNLFSLVNTSFLFLLFVFLLTNLIYFLLRFRKDIFSKTSYLTFTLDISTLKVFTAKFFAALFLNLFLIFCYYLNFLIVKKLFELILKFNTTEIFPYRFISVILILEIYWLMAYELLTLAFSFSKVKFFRKYFDFVSITFFTVLYVVLIGIMRNIYILFPYSFKITGNIIKIKKIIGIDFLMIYFNKNLSMIGINIYMIFFSFSVILISFILNLFIVKNKADL